MLLTRWANRWLAAFEHRYDHDASYMRFMLAASSRGFRLFTKVAKLVSTMGEDCGLCTQIGVQVSLEAALGR